MEHFNMKELKYMSNSKINKYKIFNFTYKICSLLFLFTIIIFLIKYEKLKINNLDKD